MGPNEKSNYSNCSESRSDWYWFLGFYHVIAYSSEQVRRRIWTSNGKLVKLTFFQCLIKFGSLFTIYMLWTTNVAIFYYYSLDFSKEYSRSCFFICFTSIPWFDLSFGKSCNSCDCFSLWSTTPCCIKKAERNMIKKY